MHEGIRRHVCDECGKAFISANDMKRHKDSVHEGLKPFPCEKCGKFFSTPEAVKNHVKIIHDNIKNFACDLCEKSYSQPSLLKASNLYIHSLVPIDYYYLMLSCVYFSSLIKKAFFQFSRAYFVNMSVIFNWI